MVPPLAFHLFGVGRAMWEVERDGLGRFAGLTCWYVGEVGLG